MKTKINDTLYCFIYGHNYFRLKKTPYDTPDLICKCCKKYFLFNSDGDIIEANHRTNPIIPIRVKKGE